MYPLTRTCFIHIRERKMCLYQVVQTPNVRLRDTGAAMYMIHLGCARNRNSLYRQECSSSRPGLESAMPTGQRVYRITRIYCFLKVMDTDQPFEVPSVQLFLGNEARGSEVMLLTLVVITLVLV